MGSTFTSIAFLIGRLAKPNENGCGKRYTQMLESTRIWGEDEDDYGGGYTAEVAIRLAQQNKWAIYIRHGQHKIYAWRPDSSEIKQKENLPIICFAIHDHHAFYDDRKAAATGSAIQSVDQMNVVDERRCPKQCNIDMCGEEARENLAPFEEWNERSLQELYERAETRVEAIRRNAKSAPATDFRRRRIAEYYYTYNIHAVLEFLQHMRADKVREYRDAAEYVLKGNDEYNTVEEVCAVNDWLVRTGDDVWEYSQSDSRFSHPDPPQKPRTHRAPLRNLQECDKGPHHRSTK